MGLWSSPAVITARLRLSFGPRGFFCKFLEGYTVFLLVYSLSTTNLTIAVVSSRGSHHWVLFSHLFKPQIFVGVLLNSEGLQTHCTLSKKKVAFYNDVSRLRFEFSRFTYAVHSFELMHHQ